MKHFFFAVVIALISSVAFAQTPGATSAAAQPPGEAVETSLATPPGHEVTVSVGGYTYKEPGALSISIHGPKIGGGYTGTLSLGKSGIGSPRPMCGAPSVTPPTMAGVHRI